MEIEETVKDWLIDEGFLREKKYDENADFHFIVEFPKDNVMDVVKPKGKDSIVVACATQVAPEHINLMSQAEAKTQKNFIRDLNMGLNRFLVYYELQVNQNLLQQFIITDQIFEDGLTKNEFYKTLKKVFKSKLHCIWLIDKKFGSVKPQEKPSNENSMFV